VANILTAQQAANALRTTTGDLRMLDLLPQVDKFIERATGRDWTQDSTKDQSAITAATILLVMYFENPGMVGADGVMPFGLIDALIQLEAQALKYHKHVIAGISAAGSIPLPGACKGDQVVSVTGIYGVSGSQVASFETVISADGQIRQTSGSDLSGNIYVVIFKAPADDVIA